MIKLIVSDLDGTMLPYSQTSVSESVKERILALLEKGVHFAVSSGRTYNELIGFLPEFKENIYFICCDGSLYIKNGKSLFERPLADEEIERFFNEKQDHYSFILHGKENSYSFGNIPADGKRYDAIPVKNKFVVKEKIFKTTAYGDPLKLPKYSALRMHWDGGKHNCTQYVNRYADKGISLSDLQMRLMISPFDTVCIGDAGNDVPMIKKARDFYSVGGRCQELSNGCTKVFDNVECVLDLCLSEL